jgi:plasmid stabilization system protein ParE
LQTISKNPYAYQRKYKHYREVLAKPIPYLVVYEIGRKEIVVVAIFNAKQHPNKKFK